MPKKRSTKTRKKASSKKSYSKSKLVGYTKVKKSYALVFSKNRKLSVGKGRYKSKPSLTKAAQKYLK